MRYCPSFIPKHDLKSANHCAPLSASECREAVLDEGRRYPGLHRAPDPDLVALVPLYSHLTTETRLKRKKHRR